MIILEGPDGSGKSTLGFKISEEIGLPIIHSGGPPKSEEELTLRVIYSQDNSLLDRHPYLSEIIYGTLNGRTPMITFDKTWLWLSNNKPLIIYCSPGLDYLLKNLDKLKTKVHKSAEHLQQVRNEYIQIYNRYEELMDKIKYATNIITYNFLINTFDEIKEAINKGG